jgi:hypothetical protein
MSEIVGQFQIFKQQFHGNLENWSSARQILFRIRFFFFNSSCFGHSIRMKAIPNFWQSFTGTQGILKEYAFYNETRE